MRSRSRERSSYVSDARGRERDQGRRDRSKDRDYRRGDSPRRNKEVIRDNSRSRSRDRGRTRERMNDASREFREVKRILTNPNGDTKTDRDRRDSERSRSDSIKDNRDGRDHRNTGDRNRVNNIQPNTTGRKSSYEEHNHNNSNYEQHLKRMRRDGSFHDTNNNSTNNTTNTTTTNNTSNTTNHTTTTSKATTAEASTTEKDKGYDDKELKEIEQFLAKTGSSSDKIETTTTAKKTDEVEEEEDEEVSLTWEDPHLLAVREEEEAARRRAKRAEIANKYSTSATDGDDGVSTGVVVPVVVQLASPSKNTNSAAFDGTRGLPSPKAVIPVFDFNLPPTDTISSAVGSGTGDAGDSVAHKVNNNTTATTHTTTTTSARTTTLDTATLIDSLNGDSSLTIPTTSLHLAKLALEPSNADKPSREEAERLLIENEKAAVLQEERRERGMSDVSLYGGTGLYGAGGRVEFDMFSASPSGIEHTVGVGRKGQTVVNTGRRAMREQLVDNNNTEDPHLQSNWDDGEGYYKARIGECVVDRYRILGVVGKGVFSTVLKCVDLHNPTNPGTNNTTNTTTNNTTNNTTDNTDSSHVAIKMIRANDTMRKAADKEKSILQSITAADPHNTKYCIKLLSHMEYRNHVAMVFEYQSMNLRETLKKFGRDVGINIGAIRMYGKQLMVALEHLSKLQIVHADIKLDNILCSGDLKQVKLCDFGSAFRETDTDNDPTPYLVSRFYRAPEIILGMPYDRAIDLWSVCVCLCELFTGHVMFPGRTNNEMLKLMMAVKGKIQNKQIKTHLRAYEVLQLEPHFDQDLRFRQYEQDPITGKTILRLMDIQTPTRDLATLLRSSKAGADDMSMVVRLTDLLEKGLNLDPAKRLPVAEALRHPFFSSSAAAK